MKVALISFHRGGMAHYAAMMAHALRAVAEDMQVSCFVCADFPRELLPEGVAVYAYPIPQNIRGHQGVSWARVPGVLFRFWKDLRAWSPDLVHFNSGHLAYLPLVRRIHRMAPIVYTMHDARVHFGEWRPYERFKIAPLLRHADLVILHSDLIRDQAVAEHGLTWEKTAVIPCGLLRLPVPDEFTKEVTAHHLLMPGRIHAYKGYDVMLEALPRIAEAVPEVHLTIAGEGNIRPWRKRIEQHVERITVIQRFLPEDELVRLLMQTSVVVLPYVEASQSGAALLASACGKPVIASRVGSIPDVVEEGKTGLLVAQGSATELAEAAVQLLRDPALRRRMGAEAKAINERRYGPSVIGRQLCELYDCVMRNRKEASPS